MKKHLSKIFLVMLLVLGLGIMAYPTVANWWNEQHAARAVAAYHNVLSYMDSTMLDAQYQLAQEFNERLRTVSNRWTLSTSMHERYYNTLDISGTGLMCMIEIPKLQVSLPVYHGDSDAVLQDAIGHMEGSSLPVGGNGSHAVLVGHTGLPGADLFTGLDTLEVGDRFILETLNKKLVYEVSTINVVLPGELELLSIDKDSDLVTLLTCTPYGVNSHRLLVTGSRVEFEDDAEAERVISELESRGSGALSRTVLIALAIGLLLTLILTALWLRRWIQGR